MDVFCNNLFGVNQECRLWEFVSDAHPSVISSLDYLCDSDQKFYLLGNKVIKWIFTKLWIYIFCIFTCSPRVLDLSSSMIMYLMTPLKPNVFIHGSIQLFLKHYFIMRTFRKYLWFSRSFRKPIGLFREENEFFKLI